MRVAVLIKYVPEVSSDLRFSTDHRVVREASDGTLNELDEHAVEAALRLVAEASGASDVPTGAAPGAGAVSSSNGTTTNEATGPEQDLAGEVIALTMAPEHGSLALRKSFQMGVSRGIRLTDDALVDSDTFGTAAALAAAIRKLGEAAPIDAVVTGIASSDGATGVLAALMAAELGWPLLSYADSVTLDPTTRQLTITRHTDEANEAYRAPLPVVLSVTDAANTVRTPNFKLIMAARKAPIEAWSAAELDLDPELIGAQGSRIAVVDTSRIPPKPPAPTVHDDGAGSGARALLDFLVERDLVEKDLAGNDMAERELVQP